MSKKPKEHKEELVKSPLTKEEILAKMKGNVDFQRRIKFAREQFWPALGEAAENIQDAQILLEGFNTTIMQAFLARMKDIKMNELDLESKLDKTSARYEQNKTLLHLFDDMTLFDAKDNIEGMKGEIQQFIIDELRARPLSTLKPLWIDEL